MVIMGVVVVFLVFGVESQWVLEVFIELESGKFSLFFFVLKQGYEIFLYKIDIIRKCLKFGLKGFQNLIFIFIICLVKGWEI